MQIAPHTWGLLVRGQRMLLQVLVGTSYMVILMSPPKCLYILIIMWKVDPNMMMIVWVTQSLTKACLLYIVFYKIRCSEYNNYRTCFWVLLSIHFWSHWTPVHPQGGGGGALLRIFGGAVWLSYPNPNPISDKNKSLPKIGTNFHTWFLESIPILRRFGHNEDLYLTSDQHS